MRWCTMTRVSSAAELAVQRKSIAPRMQRNSLKSWGRRTSSSINLQRSNWRYFLWRYFLFAIIGWVHLPPSAHPTSFPQLLASLIRFVCSVVSFDCPPSSSLSKVGCWCQQSFLPPSF
jgi:hypothetical protein